MSIKYEHLLCVSDALGTVHVPFSLVLPFLSFGLFFPLSDFLQPCLESCLRISWIIWLTSSLEVIASLHRKYSQFFAKAHHKHSFCVVELMFLHVLMQPIHWVPRFNHSLYLFEDFKCNWLKYCNATLFCFTHTKEAVPPYTVAGNKLTGWNSPSYLTDRRQQSQFGWTSLCRIVTLTVTDKVISWN